MIVAGEASGDLHGANLARELLKRDSTLQLSGIGGTAMGAAGVRLYCDIENLAVMGLFEVLGRLKDIRRAMRTLENLFRTGPPDLLILIDYPGFNLELARRAKKFNIPVLYYISPKVWAWREGRIKAIKRYVDRMAVILPFEKEYYQKHGISVDFVGNPLLGQVRAELTPAEFRLQNNIRPDVPLIGIMPGSRRQEIARLLPLFLETAAMLHREIEKGVFLLPLASTLSEDDVALHGGKYARQLDIRVIKKDRYTAMAACDAAMAASGTLTMELAILGVPMVVCYRLATLTYLLAKPFIKVESASLVNLVAGREVVPELLQKRATPAHIHREIVPLLQSGPTRETMRQELARVCTKLGRPGASSRTADIAMEMLGAGAAPNG
jgi:lipid-A-disaccharide synthase